MKYIEYLLLLCVVFIIASCATTYKGNTLVAVDGGQYQGAGANKVLLNRQMELSFQLFPWWCK